MSGKFLFIVFKGKRDSDFSRYSDSLRAFSSFGYYFDKISFVDFSSSSEMTAVVRTGITDYDDVVIYCPASMGDTLKTFIEGLTGYKFDAENRLAGERLSVYLRYVDATNLLTIAQTAADFDNKYRQNFSRAIIKVVGAPALKIKEAIENARAVCGNIDFVVADKHGESTIEFVYPSDTAQSLFDEAFRAALLILTEYVYTLGGETLEERFVKLLKLRKLNFACAESFTGGGISKKITSVSGASEVFFEGLNTYSNEAKMARLGVRSESLENFGAVSEEVCAQMAEGLILSGNCDLAVSTTGIAGPKSDNTLKPVGLAYIGIATRNETKVYKFELKGTREEITETAINFAIFLAFKAVK